MSCELTVIVKDEERTFKQKFLEYEAFTVDENDPLLRARVSEVLKSFNGAPEDVIIKISLIWK